MPFNKSIKNTAIITFSFYMLCLLWVVILKCNLRAGVLESRSFMSEMTFWERAVLCTGNFLRTTVPDAVVNIFIFIPSGLLLPFIIKKNTYLVSALIGTTVSLAAEITQLTFCIGCFTYIDVINNSLGAFFGVMLHFPLSSIVKENQQDIALKVSSVMAMSLLVFATMSTIVNIDIYL
jgi:glycopeptide antibiotics resistance protein